MADRLRPWHYLLLALIALALYLPGQISLPPTDRDESRFAQASKQMLESGNYTDIHFQDENRYKKPIGIYWLQSAAVKLTGAAANEIWAYRLPSLLAAIGAVLLTAAIGARLFTPAVGFMAGLLLASSLLLNIEARLAKTDATLLLTILAAHYAVITIWLKRATHKGYAALFWLALGAGILIKGPIILIPLVPVIACLCWRERSAALLKNLAPHWGLPLFLAIVLPWFIMITLKSGSAFWQASAGHDLIGKVTSGQESHGLPPGYYAVAFWASFWPGSILAFLALPFIRANWRQEKIALLLSWILPVWLLFEAVPTKLPHYVLPAYPAIALLAAAALQIGLKDFKRPVVAKLGWAIWLIVSAGLILGFALLPIVTPDQGTNFQVPIWQLLAASAAVPLLIWWLRRGATLPAPYRVATLGLIAAIFMLPLFSLTLPAFRHIWIARQVEDAIAAEGCRDARLISARFNEPSMVFLNGTMTVLNARGAGAADWLAVRPAGEDPACRFALVSRTEWEGFLNQLEATGTAIERVADIRGFSYSTGKAIDMQLVRRPRSQP